MWGDQYAIMLRAGYKNPVDAITNEDWIYVTLDSGNKIESVWKSEGGVLDKAAAQKQGKKELYGVAL